VEAQCRSLLALGDAVFAWEVAGRVSDGELVQDPDISVPGEWWRTKVRTGWMLRDRSLRQKLGRFRARLEYRQLERLFRAQAPDAVLLHYPIESSWPAAALAEHFSVPLICFLHGDDVALLADADPRLAAVRRRIIGASCLTILTSTSVRDLAVKLGLVDTRSSLVLPLGVNCSDATAAHSKEIVHVSNMADVKRVPSVMRAFAKVLGGFPGATLKLVGTNPTNDASLRCLAKELQIADSVRFVPFTADPQGEMRESCALLLASEREGLPLVALEAMAMGIPVVGPAVGILVDLRQEDGVCVVGPPHDPELEEKLAAACLVLLRRKDVWKALSLGAHEYAKSHFDRTNSIHAQRAAILRVIEKMPISANGEAAQPQWI
jgi:glycosyltransferase involved in cell wall biosynthesis